jgi:YfiH family protein
VSIKFHFFGKDCIIDRELKNRANLRLALQEKNFISPDVLFANQVHGKDVLVIDSPQKIHGSQNLPKADAIVTNLPGLAIGVVTADCAPILFFDLQKKIVAATHAGWRGALSGVILATIEKMKKLGAEKISAVVGPMIAQDSYEVGADFLPDFLVENSENKSFFKNSLNPGKYMFDLPAYIDKKLENCGLEKINNCHIDTYKNEESFFSFRRAAHRKETDCGRNISVIEFS